MPFSDAQAGHGYIVRLGRLHYKRLGAASLDVDDSQFCSAAVPGEDWGEIESLRNCSAASELRCGETRSNNDKSARPRTNHRDWHNVYDVRMSTRDLIHKHHITNGI